MYKYHRTPQKFLFMLSFFQSVMVATLCTWSMFDSSVALKCTCILYLPQMFLKISAEHLV